MGKTVIEDFIRWLSMQSHSHTNLHLTPDIKLAAFRLVSRQKNVHLMSLIAKAYEFNVDAPIFLPLIEVIYHLFTTSDCQ